MMGIIEPLIEAGYSEGQIIKLGIVGFFLVIGVMLVTAKIIGRIKGE